MWLNFFNFEFTRYSLLIFVLHHTSTLLIVGVSNPVEFQQYPGWQLSHKGYPSSCNDTWNLTNSLPSVFLTVFAPVPYSRSEIRALHLILALFAGVSKLYCFCPFRQVDCWHDPAVPRLLSNIGWGQCRWSASSSSCNASHLWSPGFVMTLGFRISGWMVIITSTTITLLRYQSSSRAHVPYKSMIGR